MKTPDRDSLSLHCFPQAVRIAIALSGNETISKKITNELLRQSLKAAPRWRDEPEAARWFARHAVLLSRELADASASPNHDPLLALTEHPTHQLILRTLRFLPSQQREAYFLSRGESFTTRQLATAMDCSTQAAGIHLRAAEKSLSPLAAADVISEFNASLPELLKKAAPSNEQLILQFQKAQPRGIFRKVVNWLARLLRARPYRNNI